jgi:hypothetical protein
MPRYEKHPVFSGFGFGLSVRAAACWCPAREKHSTYYRQLLHSQVILFYRGFFSRVRAFRNKGSSKTNVFFSSVVLLDFFIAFLGVLQQGEFKKSRGGKPAETFPQPPKKYPLTPYLRHFFFYASPPLLDRDRSRFNHLGVMPQCTPPPPGPPPLRRKPQAPHLTRPPQVPEAPPLTWPPPERP